MTKNRAKKRAEEMAPEPMDSSIAESKTGSPSGNNPRACWAIKTLVAEVLDLFPETPVEYSNPNGRNTALDVTFDGTALDTDDYTTLSSLLSLIEVDARVDLVIAHGTEQQILVSMHNNPRTQDSRESFGLGDALDILADQGEGSGDLILYIESDLTEGESA